METEGLYYKIKCRSELTGRVRIFIKQGSCKIPLGLCVPYPDGIGIQTRIPVKIFSEETPEFFVEEDEKERFLPISGKEPIFYLDRIMKARFAVKEGKPGLIFPESALQDSGQNP